MSTLLSYAYVAFFWIIFFSDNINFIYTFYLFILAPIALIPLDLVKNTNLLSNINQKIVFSYRNTQITLNFLFSKIIYIFSVFLSCISLSTVFNPQFSIEWFWAIIKYLLSILLFVIITSRLAYNYATFYSSTLCLICLGAGLNAFVNLANYLWVDLASLQEFLERRFYPVYGLVPDHYSTTAAIHYGQFFVYTCCIFDRVENRILRYLLILSALFLLILLYLTGSRASMAICLTFLIIILLLKGNKLNFNNFKSNTAWVAFGLLFIAGYKGMLSRLDGNRLEIWKKFLKLAYDRPIFGIGERLQLQVELSDGNKIGHAHNIFLSAYVRGGVVSNIALIYLSYTLTNINLRFYLKSKDCLPLFATTFSLIAGLVDFDLLVFMPDWQWIAYWFPIGLTLAAEKKIAD
jgi:O-antigen ligase